MTKFARLPGSSVPLLLSSKYWKAVSSTPQLQQTAVCVMESIAEHIKAK
jgi:hypothetical protein